MSTQFPERHVCTDFISFCNALITANAISFSSIVFRWQQKSQRWESPNLCRLNRNCLRDYTPWGCSNKYVSFSYFRELNPPPSYPWFQVWYPGLYKQKMFPLILSSNSDTAMKTLHHLSKQWWKTNRPVTAARVFGLICCEWNKQSFTISVIWHVILMIRTLDLLSLPSFLIAHFFKSAVACC